MTGSRLAAIRQVFWALAGTPPSSSSNSAGKGSGNAPPSGTAAQKSPFQEPADRIRDAARWLLGAFAVVGALFAAGLQLQSIGQLEAGTPRFAATAIGLLTTVVGISTAIAGAASVIGKSHVSLHWLATSRRAWLLRRALDDDAILLPGFGSVQGLYETVGQAKGRLVTTLNKHYANEINAAATLPKHQAHSKSLDSIVANVVEVASYLRLLRAWRWAKAAMFLGAVLTVCGLASFAWGSHNPAPTDALPRTPTPVLVDFDRAQLDGISRSFGDECDLEGSVPGVAVDATGDVLTVAFPAREGCSAALLTVAPSMADVRLQPATPGEDG